MHPDHNFEDRLLTELRPIVAGNPAPAATPQSAAPRHDRPARRFALAGAAALALAAVAAVITATGDPESAYAVDKADNGTISVEVHGLSDAAGLEAKLRAAGVDATVNYNAKDACTEPRMTKPGTAGGGQGPTLVEGERKHVEKAEGGAPQKSLSTAGSPPPPGGGAPDGPGPGGIAIEQGKDGARFTITPGALPQDGKLIIDANLEGGLHSLGVAIVKGDAPELTCG